MWLTSTPDFTHKFAIPKRMTREDCVSQSARNPRGLWTRRKPMAESGSEAPYVRIPTFIQKQLDNPPLLPDESAREFNSLFREIASSAEGGKKTAADFAIDYQATVLIWSLKRYGGMIVAVTRHKHPAAVAALIRRTSIYGETEPGSLAFREAHADSLKYFASEEAKNQMLERFTHSGYAANAVEVEAFEHAFSQITCLNRQQAVARQQLLVFLKEIDRRNSRRAKELREVARKAISLGQAFASENVGASS
jgi:hypothetical protein